MYNGADQYLAHSMRFYDEHNQSSGAIGANGRLTREIAVWNLNQRTLSQITNQQLDGRDTRYTYHGNGNLWTTSSYAGGGWVKWTGSAWQASPPGNGSAARTTTTTYETTFHALPISVTNPLGHTETAGYDLRMGTLTSVTDANGVSTSASYDSFGRFSSLMRPGDSPSYPTTWAWYYDWEQPVRVVTGQREDAAQSWWRPTTRSYDGLGQLIQTKVESQDGAQQIVSDTRYDGLGRVTQQSVPRYVSMPDLPTFWAYTPVPGSGVAWTTTAYDALGRVSSLTEPDGAVTRTFFSVGSGGTRITDLVDARRHRMQELADSWGRRVASQEITGNCGGWGYSCGGSTTTPWAHSTSTSYAYTPLDLLTQVTDAHGN